MLDSPVMLSTDKNTYTQLSVLVSCSWNGRLSFGSSVKAELKSELNLKAQRKSSNPLGFLCLHFLLPSFLLSPKKQTKKTEIILILIQFRASVLPHNHIKNASIWQGMWHWKPVVTVSGGLEFFFGWHVSRNPWPHSLVLTGTLVTIGTQSPYFPCFVSLGSWITSHLNQMILLWPSCLTKSDEQKGLKQIPLRGIQIQKCITIRQPHVYNTSFYTL